MDLSNLSNNLPLYQEPSEDAINEISKELSDEFKLGARSIAALYRLSNTKNSLLIAKGYLDCLNDFSRLLEGDQITSLSELKELINTKKKDLSPSQSNSGQKKQEKFENKHKGSEISIDEQTSFPPLADNSFRFTFNDPTNLQFKPSTLSSFTNTETIKNQENHTKGKKYTVKASPGSITYHSNSSSDEEVAETDDDDASFDDTLNIFAKRKLHAHTSSKKKQKHTE